MYGMESEAEESPHVREKSVQADNKIPIIYDDSYNIRFFGIQKLHPFDSCKYAKVFDHLKNMGFRAHQFYTPEEVTQEQLLKVHSKDYLDSLSNSYNIAHIVEIPVGWFPNSLLQWKLLGPMRKATGGTLLGVDLAVQHGWAINLSGGYHHAKAHKGGGFCVYADIPLAAQKYLERNPLNKVLIIDLDAHQGNGHESACKNNKQIAIFDVYNADIYPRDCGVKENITFDHPIKSGMGDEKYLELLEKELPKAIEKTKPDFIIYNAGTDILEGDPLGELNISAEGIKKRDAFVFEEAKKCEIPILMVLSGGYTRESAPAISASIENIIINIFDQKPNKETKSWFGW